MRLRGSRVCVRRGIDSKKHPTVVGFFTTSPRGFLIVTFFNTYPIDAVSVGTHFIRLDLNIICVFSHTNIPHFYLICNTHALINMNMCTCKFNLKYLTCFSFVFTFYSCCCKLHQFIPLIVVFLFFFYE